MNSLCRHYLECGGCELQHLNAAQYLSYKTDSLLNKLANAQIIPNIIEPLFMVGPHKRRRCTLQIEYKNGKILLGFFQKKSHIVVDMDECLVLTSNIFSILAPLRQCLAKLPTPKLLRSVYILDSDSGLDLLITATYIPELQCLERLVEFAKIHNIARITWQRNSDIIPIFTAKTILSSIGNIQIELPPGTFLQATKECEQFIQRQILGLVNDKIKKIIDLYAGCGTFSLIFDNKAHVLSVEGEKTMTDVITKSIKRYNLKNKQVTTRDLFDYPITAKELAIYDLAIIDPPRNGASPQIKELAESKIKNIMMISCNIDSFIRDAKLLLRNGYALEKLTPIDQFYWTKHLELTAFFSC